MFKWAVENQLIEPSVLHGLQAVSGLRAGRSGAKETAPVRPVPDAFVDAVLPFVSPQVAAMIELQRVTGMRSRRSHRHAWLRHQHGGQRVGVLTAAAQDGLARPPATGLPRSKGAEDHQAVSQDRHRKPTLFSPADAEAERNGRRFGVVSPDRKTNVYPSELRSRQRRRDARHPGKRRRPLGTRYETASYLRAVCYGIEAANRARLAEAQAKGIDADHVELVPHWHPHQLRHNAATNLRREHGIEIARIILGHRRPAITEVYAEVDHARAIDVMAKIG